ncbi:MAG: cysteine--tRNA ligase [Planctomycetota bacterium]
MSGVFRLHNTRTKSTEPFRAADPGRVTFYSCGPTVYDDAHIGNFRAFLAADLLRRWLESPLCRIEGVDGVAHDGPREVVHVMNITDVGHMTDDGAADGGGEDKMARAAERLREQKKAGRAHAAADLDPGDPFAVAGFYAARFADDAKKLGLKVASEAVAKPDLMPRATANVSGRGGMIELIGRLVEGGAAYAVGEPGRQTVYFSVESSDDYGALSGNTLESVRSGAGGRVDARDQSEKRHPADFLLWKSDPDHLMKWGSPWGEGYPGWHIECSAMAMARLGDVVDVHSGGEDNIFPHHECERAQSCAASGEREFARQWFHARYLMVEGRKMSKSAGTFFTARDLFAQGHEPAALRLALVGTHYRSNMNFTVQGLKDAARIVARWRSFLDKCDHAGGGPRNGRAGDAPAQTGVERAFADAMSDDLNVAGAVGAVNAWVAEAEPSRAAGASLRRLDAVLGVLGLERPEQAETTIGVFLDGLAADGAVVSLLEERRDAKKQKDFARADAIRDELAGLGLAIKDVAGGRVEVSRA